MRVTSVDNEGTATVQVAAEDVSVAVDGRNTDVPSEQMTLDMKITKDGRVVSAGGFLLPAQANDAGLGMVPGMDQFTPLLADNSVEPGDSWTKDFAVPFPFGEGSIEDNARNRSVDTRT